MMFLVKEVPGFTALCSSLSSLNSRRKKQREREVARCSAGGSVLRVRNEPHACSVDRHVPMQRRWWLPGSHQSSPRLAPTSASHGPLTGHPPSHTLPPPPVGTLSDRIASPARGFLSSVALP